MVIIASTSILPLFWMLLNSFKPTTEIMTGNSFGWPKEFQLTNYIDAIVYRNVLRFFLNSVVITTLTLILTLTVSVMLSYALTRMRWRLRTNVRSVILLGLLLPSQIVIIPLFLLFRQVGLINNPLSLILTVTAFNIPMSTLMISSFMQNIPFELEEAAVMDGAKLPMILFRIILPIIKPAIATAGINVFIGSWNEFMYALVLLTGEKYRTLPISLISFSSPKFGTDYGSMYATMVVTSIIPILVFMFFNDSIEKSFSASALLK